MHKKIGSVAVICLDGAVSMYADSLSFVAWKLRREGMDVVRFGCEGVLDTCTSINSTGMTDLVAADKEIICRRCRAAQREIAARNAVRAGRNDTAYDGEALQFLAEVGRRLGSSGKAAEVLDMTYRGYPLCQIAFFDFSIVTKLAFDTALRTDSIQRFIAGVRDLITLLNAFERVSKAHNLSHIVYVNGNYTQHTLARSYFGQRGVVCLSVEPQLTSQHALNRIMLAPGRLVLEPDGLYPEAAQTSRPLSGSIKDAAGVLKNFGARIRGADFNAYTSLDGQLIAAPEVDRLKNFLSRHARIHSFFLSSQDELVPHIITHGVSSVSDANPLGPFRNQLEFTTYLMRLAAQCSDVGFVIRLHPRMAANKRDRFESEEHIRYRDLLASEEIPENVLILFGDSKVSSYYVISKSDLVIVSWSTIGLESLLLGVPVIAAFPGYLMYPIERFVRQPTNRKEMEALLEGKAQSARLDDLALITWMSMAFEGQFFATAAPRGLGGIYGKAYRVLYRLAKKTGAYRLLAEVINRLFLREVKVDPQRLLHTAHGKFLGQEIGADDLIDLLREYRKTNCRLLDEYDRRIANVQ